MSFYTALTGLNGAQSDISATSNNIANVGTTGFKRSRAEFGDIFATSPLQNSSSSIGSGAILKGVKQQFTQGNIASSLNALDMAISGQGFFALKPSLTSTQVVYTRNGSFNVDNNRNVVDSSGQFLLAYPVNEDGSVTAKDILSASPLRLPVTSGDPKATSLVDLAVNLPASASVVTEKEQFANGYTFDPNDPESFTNSTSFTIFDDLGNPTIATVYFIKTQRATAEDATNKFETRLVINNEVVSPDLVPAVNDSNQQIYIDQFGNQTTAVPDPSYFDTGRSSPLYKLDDIRTRVPSEPAALSGESAGFDFGEEGTRQIEIVTDPMLFSATYEADSANQGVYWGRDFLLVNIDDGTRPVSIDVRAGNYNAEQLAAEVERAINDAHDDARKLQIQQGADDTIAIQFYTSDADGDTAVDTNLEIDLLETSFVSTQAGIDVANLTSPSFDLDVFLAHAQARINDTLDKELTADSPAVQGIAGSQFAKLTSTKQLTDPPEMPQILSFDYTSRDLGVTVSNSAEKWEIAYDEGKFTVTEVAGVTQSGDTTVTLSIPGKTDIVVTLPDTFTLASEVLDKIDAAIESLFTVDPTGTVTAFTYNATAGTLTVGDDLLATLANETFEVYGVTITVAVDDEDDSETVAQNIMDAIEAADIDGVSVSLNGKVLTFVGPTLNKVTSASETANTYDTTQSRYIAYTNFVNRPAVEVFDRANNVAEGVGSIVYDSEADNISINMQSTAGLKPGDTIVLMGAGSAATTLNGRSFVISTVTGNMVDIATGDLGLPDDDISIDTTVNSFVVLSAKSSDVEAYFEGADLSVDGFATSFNNQRIVVRETDAARHSYTDAEIIAGSAGVAGVVDVTGLDGAIGVGEVQTADMSGVTFGDIDAAIILTIGSDTYTTVATSFADAAAVAAALELVGVTGYTVSASTTNLVITADATGAVTDTFSLSGGGTASAEVAAASFTETTAGVTAVTAVAQISSVDASSFEVEEGDVFTVIVGDVTLTYTALSSDTSIANVVTGLQADVGYDTDVFTLTESSGEITATYTTAKAQDDTTITIGKNLSPRSIFGEFTDVLEGNNPSVSALGLSTAATKMAWVDDLVPPIKVVYDASSQSIRFDIDHTALGPGGSVSNVSSIQVSSGNSDGVNGIGLLGLSAAPKVAISSATRVTGQAFIFDGPNQGEGADRFGASVQYDRDTGAFTFKSGTTGKEIDANKALGVTTDQLASNIQVGRYSIDRETGEAETGDGTIDLASRVLALGSSHVMGVGNGKNVGFVAGTGLKSQPARAVGAPANDPLNSEPVFLNPANLETTFNVSVNGVNSVIDIPGGNYIGSTLAEVLEKRINQMRDPDTGNTIGGVTVRYQPDDNNFVFTTGTTGADSTIRVKGSAKLGLDDVPLGIGSVPTIANLVQATNANGIPLFVNENGDIVDSEPDNLVTDYFPLYLDEGELTFDKTGKLTSPKGLTRYESQSETFSISLDIDYSASSQLATPFVVNNLEQNGFTSGRLDGLSIDATGLLRANYTNGQNKPLGKIVLANFNNQNGLKQVGNATFVETASSGTAIIGEAGTEGFGSIQSGALERSNVDITEELVNLITAQRNFQAASKAIETSTQLTQTIINIRT